jgi:4-hydroxybenzoate polyprenyltransferase
LLNTLKNLARLARPGHWIKNTFVFAALIFSRHLTQLDDVLTSLLAFAAFCLASSAVYALNDVCDRNEDARHPKKCRRPVASGEISPGAAAVLALILNIAAIAIALKVGPAFAAVLGIYLAIMLGYVLGLKRVAILDVLILAVGFVLRAYAGGVAIDVWVSPWLILCTLTLALFLGFAKRESERVALGAAAAETRLVEWRIYDEKSIEHMMTVSAALAVVTYMLYTVSPETIQRVGNPWMFVTVLPVVYGVFRFYRMAIMGRAGDAVEMVRRDPAFVVTVLAWLAMVALVLMSGRL